MEILIGGYGGLKLAADDDYFFELAPPEDYPEENLNEEARLFDFGPSVGLRFFRRDERAFIRFRLDVGITSISKRDEKRAYGDFVNKSDQRLWNFMVSYGFKLWVSTRLRHNPQRHS